MVTPSEVLSAIERSLQSNSSVPDELSYLLHEADSSSSDADVTLPLVEIQITNNDRVHLLNTEFAGYKTDDNGNQTGYVYHSEYELLLQIDVWTASGGDHEVNNLGDIVRNALYTHSSFGPQQPFADENGDDIDEIFRFSMEEETRADDLISTPTIRRWRIDAEVWAYEQFTTDEDYIVSIDLSDPDVMG